MIDKLMNKIELLCNPAVVGLDPTYEMMPDDLKKKKLTEFGRTPKAVAEMFIEFNHGIIDSICDIVPAVKPQIAMYEKYGLEGLRAYLETTSYAREKALLVIGDIKRGDIASTAAAYAAHIGGVDIEGSSHELWYEDAVTLNPYLGVDGIGPFLSICEDKEKAIFILVRTSNPSSSEVQDSIYKNVGALVSKWGESTIGASGYSKVGAVVGATHKEEGEILRELMPHSFFLIPGYGAQGATAQELKGFFNKGKGAIVNSSRGITAAWKNDNEDSDYRIAARNAAIKMREDLQVCL